MLDAKLATPRPEAAPRDMRIDVLRGITMLLVVAIHVLPEGPARCFSLVTMPLAFMLSGHLHHQRPTAAAFARDKALSLLVPYAAYLLLFGAFWAAGKAREGVPLGESLATLLYGGERLKGSLGIFWFITCLFITQQAFHCVQAWPALRARLPWIALGAYLAALANQHLLGRAPLPLAANVALMGFVFYAFGQACGGWLLGGASRLEASGRPGRWRAWLPAASAGVALAGVALELRFGTLHFEMKRTAYGWPLVSPLVAVALAFWLAAVARGLLGLPPLAATLGRALAWAGRATVTIMFVHQFLHHALLREFAREHPLAALVLIYVLCCGLHALLGLNRWTRAILRGERRAWHSEAQSTRADARPA